MTALVLRTRAAFADAHVRIQKVGGAWLFLFGLFAALMLLDQGQAASSISFTASSLAETAPYLVLSIAIAAYAGPTGADGLVARAFTGSPFLMIAVAAAFGGLAPFCSCGVIPLIAALLSMGVPLSAVMAFWLSSPVIDPSMFVMTSGLLGAGFAVAKTFSAVGVGLFGGYVTLALTRSGKFSEPLREGVGYGGCCAAPVRKPGTVAWRFWQDRSRTLQFWREGLRSFVFLFKWLTLAFFLESLMLAYVPADWVAVGVGGKGFLPIVAATLIGVPAYLNGYAALPLVSGLIHEGMSPGAGLAFLVGGGITSVPAAIAVYALVRKRIFFLYLLLAMLGSVASGIAYQGWMG